MGLEQAKSLLKVKNGESFLAIIAKQVSSPPRTGFVQVLYHPSCVEQVMAFRGGLVFFLAFRVP